MKLQQRASRCCAGNPPRREAQPQIKARCLASQTQSIRRPRFSGYLRPGTPNRVRQIASAPLLLDLDDSFASKIAASMKFDIEDWLPKSAILLRHYDRHKFASDLIAGVTVGLVALPLAMAFAIASGVPPQAGLYCAIVTGFLISALGGSKTQIGGPTGAFVVVVAGIIAKHGIDGLFMCTMMAGVLLVLLGITGMGAMVKYFPRPVVVGFTNGIAILIASTQIRDFFGLKMDHVPGDFFHRMKAFAQAGNTFSMPATAVSIFSIAVMIFCLKYAKKIPGAILVTFGATAAVILFHMNLETIGTRFGGIPKGLPTIAVPKFHYDIFRQLLSSAFTVAMLGAIESLMSAVVSDRMSNDKHNPNVELIGQGVANILSPLFGGLPATGAIARTATNVRSGAKTPVAGMIHALTLLGIILFAAPLVKSVPLAALASILMIVAYNMGDWEDIPDYAIVYRIHGPFLFGATDKFADILHSLDKLPPILILRLRNMTAIDATGLGAIRDLADTVHESGRSLLLCGAREQPSQLMKQAEFERHVGAENICESIAEALERAAEVYRSQYAGKAAEEPIPARS